MRESEREKERFAHSRIKHEEISKTITNLEAQISNIFKFFQNLPRSSVQLASNVTLLGGLKGGILFA